MYTPDLIAAAKDVIVTRLRHWDAELALEKALGRDLLNEDSDLVGSLCSRLSEPETVTDAEAITLLNELVQPQPVEDEEETFYDCSECGADFEHNEQSAMDPRYCEDCYVELFIMADDEDDEEDEEDATLTCAYCGREYVVDFLSDHERDRLIDLSACSDDSCPSRERPPV